MATVSISQLDTATQAKVDDLYEVAVVDENSQTGYASRNLTAAQIATLFAQDVQFSGLSTEAKTIIAAINEAAQNGGTEVEANPTGTPTDTLETIGIDGTIYEVSGSEPVSKTVTGNPISITDAADAPIVSGEVTFEPKQDLHGYDKPWAGGAGKNKLKVTATSTTSQGVTFTVNDDGSIACSGTATGIAQLLIAYEMPITSNVGTVTLSGLANTTNIVWNYIRGFDDNDVELFADASGSTLDKTFDLSQYPTLSKISISIKRYQDNVVSGTIYPQLELGSQATSFAPYSNICPITGYDDCEVEVTGKNLLEVTATIYTNNGVIFTVNSDGSVVANGTATDWAIITLNYFTNSNPGIISLENGSNNIYMGGVFSGSEINTADGEANIPPAENVAINLVVSPGTTVNNVILYPMIRLATETDPTWEPYQSIPYTIDLAGTRYGGKVDLASGVMTVTQGYIATYAGETIGEPWISDRDEYVAGTTPSTGAEVVYTLATPTTVQLTPEQIRTLEGTNNISTNMPGMSLEYITQDYQPLVKLIERSAGHHYSTRERVIGTWIDGKPLYEQTFNVSSLTANDTWQEIANVGLKLLINFECISYSSTESGKETSFDSGKNTPQIKGNSSSGKLFYALVPGTSITGLYVTARYTKTTD